jgi:antitoxin (DNA-binding transcriptional repressor) of toxin-antitoxin stability system
MYIGMKRYTVSQARMRISEVLDCAERGEAVIIDRQGVRFEVVLAKAKTKAPRKRAPVLRVLDPAVAAGDWTWSHGPDGLTFVPGKRR